MRDLAAAALALPRPDRERIASPRFRLGLRALALALVYAGIFKLIAIETSFGTSIGATFWPASGVTVSVLARRPRREWPAYLVAIYIADFVMDIASGGYSVRVSYGLALSNCLEPLLSAGLLRIWLRARPDLSRLRDLGAFYVAATVCGPLLGALVASLWPWLLGATTLWPRIGRWYVGDALGVVIVAPLLLSLRWPSRTTRPRLSAVLQAAALTAVIAVAVPWRFAAEIGLPFMVIAAVSVIGIRLRTRAAAAAVFALGMLVETLTAYDLGPFAGHGAFTGLLSAQMYLAACSVSALTAAALMTGLISRDQMALHDHLTGLANRRLLMERIAVACGRLARHPGLVGLVFIDLDDFKAINDGHGHAAGDRVLVETARRLRAVIRDGDDTIARIGGDEFVILIGEVSGPAFLAQLAERVRQVVAEPIVDDEMTVRIGASIGWSTTDRPDESREGLLARADDAMYTIKRARPLSSR